MCLIQYCMGTSCYFFSSVFCSVTISFLRRILLFGVDFSVSVYEKFTLFLLKSSLQASVYVWMCCIFFFDISNDDKTSVGVSQISESKCFIAFILCPSPITFFETQNRMSACELGTTQTSTRIIGATTQKTATFALCKLQILRLFFFSFPGGKA